MNTEQLYAFRTTYECRSFTKAAKLLFKSQSAVTQLIHSLETEMDAALFVRHTRPVKATATADRFYHYAVTMLDAYEESLSACKPQHAGGFQLHYMATFVGVMDRFIASQQPEQLPEIVKIDLDDFIRTDRWQPGILYLVRKPVIASKNIDQCPAYTSKAYAQVPVQSPLAQKEVITLKDLEQVPVILPPTHLATSFTSEISRLLSKNSRIRVELINGVENGLMYAIRNGGVCFCTEEFMRPKEHIRYIPFDGVGDQDYCFATPGHFSPEMKAFIQRFRAWRLQAGQAV